MTQTRAATRGLSGTRRRSGPAGSAAPAARVLRRLRYLAAVAAQPSLAGPPIALGRRCSIRLGPSGSLLRGTGLTLADGFSAVFDAPVSIGSDVFFNRDANLSVYAGLTVGDGCRFGERFSLHDEDHVADRGTVSGDYLVSPIRIGARVWIGANVVVLRGVSIGDDAVIGAGAVVLDDVPPGGLAVGVPARTVRTGS